MTILIKDHISGKMLIEIKGTTLSGADLRHRQPVSVTAPRERSS